MVDMRHIIAYRQRSQLFKGNILLFVFGIFDRKTKIPLKNLMVGVTGFLVFIINKSLILRKNFGFVRNNLFLSVFFEILENIVKMSGLCLARAIQIIDIAVLMIGGQVVNQQIELLVESRLRTKEKFNFFIRNKIRIFVQANRSKME